MARRASGNAKNPQAPAISIRRLKEMTARELNRNFTDPTIKSTYVSLRKAVASRLKTFEKHGVEVKAAAVAGGLPPMGTLSVDEMKTKILSAVAWMRGSASTYKGYEAQRESRRKQLQSSMPDMDFSTIEKADKFAKFMNDMADRYGEMWHKGVSNQARDIYRELEKINEDPYQFMKNYDFWKEEVEAVNEKKRKNRQGGRRRSTQLSTYFNKIRKKKIK